MSRKRNNDPQESFDYDNLDRLISVKSGAAETMKISYAPNGNILFKTGVGNFSYDKNVRPHAVTEVENTDGKIPGDALTTSFNDFGKIQLIEDAGKSLRMDFSYGPDQERWYSELSKNDTDVRTTVYAGEYEKITENGVTREFYYLDGNTIAIRENGTVRNYHAFTDNLGSILCVMDENGTKVFDASYDAWGKQTVTLNSIGLHRGYTGHEMLSEFDIINMNGRLYDPVLGRFFSPDNYVQMPDNSQNFNSYSYCLNNPLKYTDPSGEFGNLIIGAAIEGIFNWASHGFQLNAKGLGYFATGAVAGAVGAGLASGMNVAMAGGNFWTGAAGLAKGIASKEFLAGAASGASAGFAGGFISGAGNSWVGGSSFGKGLLTGLGSGSIGALEGGIAGGLIGGFDALDKGTSFWTGKKTYSKPLGRPSKEPRQPEYYDNMAQVIRDRNEVECSFGTGKRIYRADNIRAKLPNTAECWTEMCYFAENVMKFLRNFVFVFLRKSTSGFILSSWGMNYKLKYYSLYTSLLIQ